MNENTIVSLADSKYFDLLNELIESIKSFEQSKDVDICILDAGFTPQLRNQIYEKRRKPKQMEIQEIDY